MRFGLKIFLMSFTLVVVVTNIIGLTLINNTYTTNIQNTIDKHIVEINNIMNNMIYSSTDDLVNIYYNNKTYTKIFINDVVFSTNFPGTYPKLKILYYLILPHILMKKYILISLITNYLWLTIIIHTQLLQCLI